MKIEKRIELIKSLADTSRLRILNAIIIKPQYVEEIAHRINLAASTVSFHLKKLEGAGLVKPVKEQYYITYHINSDLFGITLKELVSFENIESAAEEERIDLYRRKVLKVFFKKDRLLKLPVQHKKKLIVLDEFVKKFKNNKRYKEEEVNNVIKQSFEDYCTIRRLMIEEGMMKRENNIYWLTQKDVQND